jgi:hypothetical protein
MAITASDRGTELGLQAASLTLRKPRAVAFLAHVAALANQGAARPFCQMRIHGTLARSGPIRIR